MSLRLDFQLKTRLYSEIQEVGTADLVALAAHIRISRCLLSRNATHNVQSQGIRAAEQNPTTTATHADIALCCLQVDTWETNLICLHSERNHKEFLWMPQHKCGGGVIKAAWI